MHRTRLSAIVLGVLALGLLLGAARHSTVRAQAPDQPLLVLNALQLPTLTRYSVTVLNPSQETLGNLQLSVQLPPDAAFDHALETPGFTQFQGQSGGTLSWQALSFAPGDAIDAFTFFLAQPSSGSFAVTASWDGGQVSGQFQPSPLAATDTETDVTLTSAALAQSLVPAGNTGVLIAAEQGSIPDGTVVHVRVLAQAANPPANVGDLWWCAIVELDGLPAGTGLLLDVPARQPLPPGVPVSLFQQQGAQWSSLADEADVSLDGQYISYTHPGGTVAAGTAGANQPTLAGATTVSLAQQSQLSRQAAINRLNTAVAQEGLIQIMTQPGNCQPNCQSTPACGLGAFNPNLQIPGPTRTCVNKGGGTTTCNLDETSCHGTVQLTAVAGGVPLPAEPGHGTACVFPSFTQFLPFECRQF